MSEVAWAHETDLQNQVAQLFERLNVGHQREFKNPAGSADFALLRDDGKPWALLEVKRATTEPDWSLSEAADFFEQSVKYRLATNLPVFLGPVFTRSHYISDAFTGGRVFRTAAAFSAMAGRLDVGLFFIHSSGQKKGSFTDWQGFTFTMRQRRVIVWDWLQRSVDGWGSAPLKAIDLETPASTKGRK